MKSKLIGGVVAVALVALVPSMAVAHGNLSIDYQNGKLFLSPGPFGLLFYQPALNDFQFGFASDGLNDLPASSGGGHLVAGDQISVKILDSVLYHDGTAFVTPTDGAIQILPSGWTVTPTSGVSGVFSWTTVHAGGVVHEHLNFIQRSATMPDGAYGILFQLSSSNTAIAPSDPFMVVVNLNLDSDQMDAAITDFEELMSVPEVNSWFLMGLAGAGWALARRVRRQVR